MPGRDALVVLLVLAGMLAVTAGQATGQLVRAPGTVVRIVQDSDAMRAYRPIVAYLANDGQRREVAGNTASTVTSTTTSAPILPVLPCSANLPAASSITRPGHATAWSAFMTRPAS